MSLYALQSPAGGFLDEDLHHFNKIFDDWCVQFESLEDAKLIVESLEKSKEVDIIEITPLSYPKYFFPSLKGIIHTTREHKGKIICILEPQLGSYLRIAICDLETKAVRVLNNRYKSTQSAEGAFTHLTFDI